jgi:oligopeptide transport system substrate-binding protein
MKARSLSLALVLATLSSCGSGDDGAVAISVIGPKARIADPNKGSLDPPSAVLSGALTQGLVAFDAMGQIEPALAERWVVTDDGLSYIFRIKRTAWSDGQPVSAGEVAKSLRSALAPTSRNSLKPLFGSVSEIVAMTDWVIEVRLRSPQPNLLQLLAQPEMAVLRMNRGSGPYRIYRRFPNSYVLRPVLAEGQREEDVDPALLRNSERRVRGEPAAKAIARYASGDVALVLGGRFDDLPLIQAARLDSNEFRRDLASGLFGFVIGRDSRILADSDMRKALAMTIDRAAIISQFRVNGWRTAESVLPAPIDMTGTQAAPDWASLDEAARTVRARATVSAWAAQSAEKPVVRVAMPGGPGGRLLFAQLAADWRAIGVDAIRVGPSDIADLRLFDAVAPYNGALWYLNRFTCAQPIKCAQKADEALARALDAPDPAARGGALAEADRALASEQIFIPLATPLRWSLVSPRLAGYSENVFAIHPLNRLRRPGN